MLLCNRTKVSQYQCSGFVYVPFKAPFSNMASAYVLQINKAIISKCTDLTVYIIFASRKYPNVGSICS